MTLANNIFGTKWSCIGWLMFDVFRTGSCRSRWLFKAPLPKVSSWIFNVSLGPLCKWASTLLIPDSSWNDLSKMQKWSLDPLENLAWRFWCWWRALHFHIPPQWPLRVGFALEMPWSIRHCIQCRSKGQHGWDAWTDFEIAFKIDQVYLRAMVKLLYEK